MVYRYRTENDVLKETVTILIQMLPASTPKIRSRSMRDNLIFIRVTEANEENMDEMLKTF